MNPLPPTPPRLPNRDIVKQALHEDHGHGDINTESTVDPEKAGRAEIIAKEDGVLAGLFVAEEAFLQIDPDIAFDLEFEEGSPFNRGEIILSISGRLRSILMAERVALNFLQRLCGIATQAARYVREVEGLGCRVVGTRKTTPCLRFLEKYAIRAGGALNHRFSLSDGILIKDNHIAACGSIQEAVQKARQSVPHTLKIEVEVSDMDQLREAISAGADAILLDNMDVEQTAKAVKVAREMNPAVLIEASGGITLENIRQYAETGVDIISSGSLTHSFKSVDLSLRVKL